jgi:hypothetical protein
VEHLDLPSQGIPFELLDGLLAGPNGQIGNQLSVDLLSVLRCPAFRGMDHHQAQGGISLLFSDRRHHSNPAIADLESGFIRLAVAVSDFDTTQPLDRDIDHFVGDGVIPIAGQAVDTGPDQERRSHLLCRAENLIDVALANTDMNASPRIIQKLRGLLQILQPSDALLFLDGNARGG